MAEYDEWVNSRPSLKPRHSQQSLFRKPRASLSHRRSASDNISLASRPRPDDLSGFSRASTLSANVRQLSSMSPSTRDDQPMSGVSWLDSGDGGDLGSPVLSPAINIDSSHTSPGQRSHSDQHSYAPHDSPAPVTRTLKSTMRHKPATFNFDETSTEYSSPANSARPLFSPYGRFQHRRTDSRANLLGTASTTETWRSPCTPPPYSASLPTQQMWWRWRPMWVMYLFFLFGFGAAVGHHVFYNTLDGQPATDQLAMLRYGAILAFATKAGLVASIVVAYRQRIWTTVRSKLLSVAALDSLFAATEDLFALFNLETYRRAKVAMLLAIFVWLTPFVIILTSTTLTVEPALRVENGTCPGIRTLNFEKEGLEHWRTPTKIENLYGLSVSTWNSTTTDPSKPGWFDYYTSPSDKFVQVATHAAFMEKAIGKTGAIIDICGPGWNCTYTVSFRAPAYKCSEQASGVDSIVEPLGDQKPPQGFSTDLLLPKGQYSYYSFATGGEYSTRQLNDTEIGGMPKFDPPFPPELGTFRTEPVVWIGYAVRANPDAVSPSNASMPGWNEAFIPKVIACENYEADYEVRFNLTGGEQFTNVTKRDFIRRVIDTTWDQGETAMDDTNDNVTAHPKSNYVYPQNYNEYHRVAAFHSIGMQLRYFVNGTVDSTTINNPIQNTKAIQTKLLDPKKEYFTHPKFADLIQEFYEDILFSLFSNQQFLVNVWASKPDEITGVLPGDESTAYPCERSRSENVFRYHKRDLWLVYAVAIGLAVAGIISGTLAVLENEGVLRDTRFSSIVAATRGPALEKLGWDPGERSSGGGGIPRDIKTQKVGYGVVHRASGLGVLQEEDSRYPERMLWDAGDVRYGFGLEGDVRQMRSEGSLFRHR